MNIKTLDQYNKTEIEFAKQASPALTKYLSLLKTNNKQLVFNQQIKLLRHKYWAESAMAQLTSSHTTQEICKYWSNKTIELLIKGWEQISGNKNLALFALGKLGALELNLSSDIDLIIVSLQPANKTDLKFYRNFIDLFASHDEFGFCYRIDFNLRPGGRLGPTICSINQFEDYYWTQGATWERIALNRLLPVCGNNDIIHNVNKIRDTFCYRKFIDYSLINDIKNIRSHIIYNNSDSEKINLKLHAGGIRDIELYVNSLQVIHGGKIPHLRTTQTTLAINKLLDTSIIKQDEASFLNQTYWNYREIENLIQIENDQQTHILDTAKNLYKTYKCNLRFSEINNIVSKLIGEKPKTPPLLPLKIEDQILLLTKLGFNKEVSNKVWPQLIHLTVLAKDNQIDEIYRTRFLFKFINNVSQFGLDKNLSLHLLYDFIKSIRPKKSFYHLLEQEPNITKELAIILSSSPYLGNLIAAKPEILDSFLLKKTQTFSNNLDTLLPQLQDFKQLNQLLASSQLLVNQNVNNLTESCSAAADKISLQLLNCLKSKFPNNSIDIVKLGKWGGSELGLLSDLDFIFITDNEISEADIKISRRFINMITNRQQGGEIYNIDMRLRPQSGSSAVITTKEQFINYILNSSQNWELQSYLKARPLIGSNFKIKIVNAIKQKKLSHGFHNELFKIKEQVIKENYLEKKKPADSIDLKYSPGGLIDIEFTTQIKMLMDQKYNGETNTADYIANHKNHSQLKSNYSRLRLYEQLNQILSQNNSTLIDFKSNSFNRFSTYLKASKADIQQTLKQLLQNNLIILSTYVN